MVCHAVFVSCCNDDDVDSNERQAVLLSHPDQYIGALLGHEGPGSLLSYYKAKVSQ